MGLLYALSESLSPAKYGIGLWSSAGKMELVGTWLVHSMFTILPV